MYRRFLAFLSIGMLAFFASVGRCADKPVHIFILSGQSNMAGMNPKLGFEPEAQAAFPDAEIAYFKVAVGEQPIRYWVDQWDAIADKHGLKTKLGQKRSKDYYTQILQRYGKLIERHPSPASVTFCWMQGERDAREKLSAGYADALTQLIENLRTDLKQPTMNFVIGRLSDFGNRDNKDWQNVRKAQVEIAEKDALGAWVDCDDLNNKVKGGVTRDDLHYTTEGYELLGRRYARQAKALIEQQQPAEDGRPD